MAISSTYDSDTIDSNGGATVKPLVTEFSNSVAAPKFEARRVVYAVPVFISMTEESHFALKVDDAKGGMGSVVRLITEDDRVNSRMSSSQTSLTFEAAV